MKIKPAILLPALLLAVGIGVAYQMIKGDRTLPIYSPSMINPDLVDASKQDVVRGHQIANFELINQDGESFTEKELKGYYYVTDFFFTTCPTICPTLAQQMLKIHDHFEAEPNLTLLSHTIYPKLYTFAKLSHYSYNLLVKSYLCHFVT